MYIDSPQFPRRKVVGQKNQLAGGFGYQRIQLANYVAHQLNNNHRNDAEILQKFRKQAEEHKKNLLHRRHRGQANIHTPSQPTLQYANSPILKQTLKNQSIVNNNKINQYSQRIPTTSHQQKQVQNQQISPISHRVIRQIVRMPDSGQNQLIKMLGKKDKQIEKQFKIIKRSQEKINNLKKRLEILEYQNKIKQADRIANIQHNSYQKIKGYISSMSQRLLQNQDLLQQNFSQIKKNKNSNYFQSAKTQNFQPISPKPIIKYKPKKASFPNHKKQPDLYVQNPEPKITYNYKVGSEQQIKQEKFGINSLISNLSLSRKRLDSLGSFV